MLSSQLISAVPKFKCVFKSDLLKNHTILIIPVWPAVALFLYDRIISIYSDLEEKVYFFIYYFLFSRLKSTEFIMCII